MNGYKNLVIFKSTPENWLKEATGKKPNTYRKIDKDDDRFQLLDHWKDVSVFYVGMMNTETGLVFIRKLEDYTKYNGVGILSWKHPKGDEE